MAAKRTPTPGTPTTPNALRRREMRTFTLSPEAISRLDSIHVATGMSRSEIVDGLIMGTLVVENPSVSDAPAGPKKKRR